MTASHHGPGPPYGTRPVLVGVAALAIAGAAVVVWLALAGAGRVAVATPPEKIAPLVSASTDSVESSVVPESTLAAAAPVTTDSDLVEVCGVGWVEARGGTTIDPETLLKAPGIEEAARGTVADLAASSDEYERAVALVLHASLGSGPFDRGWRNQLAQRAVTTDDARLYAMAYRFCNQAIGLAPPTAPEEGRMFTDASCARLSAAQWARLDEGNGFPWLFVLEDAAAREDREGIDEALYRIGSASRIADRTAALVQPVAMRAGASDRELMAANALAIRAFGMAAALPSPTYQLLTNRACGDAALGDANRRQLCDSAAGALAERSDSLLPAIMGASIGRRLGWSPERVATTHALVLALADLFTPGPGAAPTPSVAVACDSVRRDTERIERIGRLGEVQIARERLVSSEASKTSYMHRALEAEARRSEAIARAQGLSPRAPTASAAASAPG